MISMTPTSVALLCCSCLKEIQCLAGMPAHRHIVGHYRAWQEAGHFYIQMDLCEHGTLAQLIHMQVSPKLPADKSGQMHCAAADLEWSLAHMNMRSSHSAVPQGRLPEETLWRVLWQLAQVSWVAMSRPSACAGMCCGLTLICRRLDMIHGQHC